MGPQYDLVMFALDGTLVESAPEICDAVNDTLRHFDLPQVTLRQVTDWVGHGTRELLIQALPYGYNMGQPIEDCAPDRVIADCSVLLNQ